MMSIRHWSESQVAQTTEEIATAASWARFTSYGGVHVATQEPAVRKERSVAHADAVSASLLYAVGALG